MENEPSDGWKFNRCREFLRSLTPWEIKIIGAICLALASGAGSLAIFVLDIRADLDHIIDEFNQLRGVLRVFFADRFDGTPR